ncbi:MAG: hypothetical protein PHT40_03275 [Patescibacteria group bacterium]|nr:hypothetical protein [Patescibacteria group bacterium]
MIWIIICLIFAFIAFLAAVPMHFYCKKYINDYKGEGWPGFAVVMSVFAGLWLFCLAINTIASYSIQVSDYYDLKKIDKMEVMYQEKAEALTTQFASYLAVSYPQHEKTIFAQISPEKVSAYAAAYPAIKSSETIMALVGEISKLQADRYQQKADRIQKQRNIDYRMRSPWTINSIIRHYQPPK